MSKKSVLVQTVLGLEHKKAVGKDRGLAAETITVRFGNDHTGVLDAGAPRSKVWADVLESVRSRGTHAYIELDPSTKRIQELLIPIQVGVTGIRPSGSRGDLEVDLFISHSRHFLRHSSPDFEQHRDLLKRALDDGSEVLVTENEAGNEIIDVRPCPKAKGAPRPSIERAPPLRGPIPTPISLAQAQILFDAMASQTCAPSTPSSTCIPFMYPDDGCWGRAHEMCRLLQLQGAFPQKVWIFGNLHVRTANNPSCGVSWGWHVAPTLLVDTPSGPAWYVVDPSIFTMPVPKTTWASVQGDPSPALADSDASVFWRNQSGTSIVTDPDYSRTNGVLATYRQKLQVRSASSSGPPPYASCHCDIFVRDNLQDEGVEPLTGGGISCSPDINHFREELTDPEAMLGLSAKMRDDLFEPIEKGQPNYIYLRLQNRGNAADSVSVDLYYSTPSTLPAPGSWSLVGSITTPPIVPGELKVVGPLLWNSVPAEGHYCFVALLGNARDPKPDLSSLHSIDDFYALIRQRNNATWKNFDVQDIFPGSSHPFTFQIQGWPRTRCVGDLELDLRGLPKASVLSLRLSKRLTLGATLDGLKVVKTSVNYVFYTATRLGVVGLRGMPLRPSESTPAHATVTLPETTPDGSYQVSALQKINGKEMGRVSIRLQVANHPYVAHGNGDEVHRADCAWVQKMAPHHRVAYRDLGLALRHGYNGCHFCLPEVDSG